MKQEEYNRVFRQLTASDVGTMFLLTITATMQCRILGVSSQHVRYMVVDHPTCKELIDNEYRLTPGANSPIIKDIVLYRKNSIKNFLTNVRTR